MGAAIHGVDVVRKAEYRLGITVVVLQADLHDHAVAVGFHVDGLVMEELLASVQVLNEFGNTAVVFELDRLSFARFRVCGALVGQRDLETFVQEGQFAQALGQGVEVIFCNCEDALVRQEMDFGSCLDFRGAGFLQLAGGLAFGVRLLPSESVTPDFEFQL